MFGSLSMNTLPSFVHYRCSRRARLFVSLRFTIVLVLSLTFPMVFIKKTGFPTAVAAAVLFRSVQKLPFVSSVTWFEYMTMHHSHPTKGPPPSRGGAVTRTVQIRHDFKVEDNIFSIATNV